MRLSSNQDDAGYAAWMALGERRRKVKILLDGIEVRDVTVADEAGGYIVRAKRDEQHLLVVDGDEIVSETVHGDVKIIVPQVH